MSRRPHLLELFCGIGGWSKAAAARGWRTTGIDVDDHGYSGDRLIRSTLPWSTDAIMELQPDAIAASPPCEEFARRHLPWIAQVGPIDERLLRWSVGLAAAAPVPVVVECSRFAGWHVSGGRYHRPYHLWGDVPALLPPIAKTKDARRGGSTLSTSARAARAAEIPEELAGWFVEYFARKLNLTSQNDLIKLDRR